MSVVDITRHKGRDECEHEQMAEGVRLNDRAVIFDRIDVLEMEAVLEMVRIGRDKGED